MWFPLLFVSIWLFLIYLPILSVCRWVYLFCACLFMDIIRVKTTAACRIMKRFIDLSFLPVFSHCHEQFYVPYIGKVHLLCVLSFSYNYFTRYIFSSFFSSLHLFFPFSYFIPVFLIYFFVSFDPLDPVYLKQLVAHRSSSPSVFCWWSFLSYVN
jgi:hypothetical protein